MFEYLSAFTTPFQWAKNAIRFLLNNNTDQQITITQATLTAPLVTSVPPPPVIDTDSDWNSASLDQYSFVAGLYKTLDQADSYANALYTTLDGRLKESESRLKQLEFSLKQFRSITKMDASTSITINGGSSDWVDTDSKYYSNTGILAAVPQESIFRLADTGAFSSTRSLGGFAGSIVIENSLGQIFETGSLSNITDGDKNTYWMGTFYAPSSVRASSGDIDWLPSDYQYGFAFALTYYLDRPTLATEVYIDPVTTEPFDLVSVQWTPYGVSNALSTFSFAGTGVGWKLHYNSAFSSGNGVNGNPALLTYQSSGWASATFLLTDAVTKTISGTVVATSSGDVIGQRCQLSYDMRGVGDCYAGARIVWLDASGYVINYKQKQDYPTGFFTSWYLVDSIPIHAVSGRIDIGIFTACTLASAFFDNVTLFVGEQNLSVNSIIDKPTTISLSKPIISDRFTFIFAQRNPRRELLSKQVLDAGLSPIATNQYVDSSLRHTTQRMFEKFRNSGPGASIFAYRTGIKELDLRYREHVPRGSLVSLPIISSQEIRRLWVTAEIDRKETSGIDFFIYPFLGNPGFKVPIQPYLTGDTSSTLITQSVQGNVLHIFTSEEVASGWTNSVTDDDTIIVDPKLVIETYDGTDRNGKLTLNHPPHLRRAEVKRVMGWLNNYSIWPTSFDPNASTLFGVTDQTVREAIQTNSTVASSVANESLITTTGYIPIKVTVETNNWVAHPDTFGRPDKSPVREATKEVLTDSTLTKTTTSKSAAVIGLDTWLNTESVARLNRLLGAGAWLAPPLPTHLRYLQETTTLRQVIDQSKDSSAVLKRYTEIYQQLKARGLLGKNLDTTTTLTSDLQKGNVYKTAFAPIISGANGSFIRLFWLNPSTGDYLPISQNKYSVNPLIGQVVLSSTPPSTAYTQVVADYKYISDSLGENFFNDVLDFTAGTTSGSGSNTTISYPITRNMTDYITGKTPELTTPDFDILSSTYYPILEYYVNSDGNLQFSRDLFKYGDTPAKIKVEVLTLDIAPRVALEMTRSGSPSTTSVVKNMSLHVKEGSATPTRSS